MLLWGDHPIYLAAAAQDTRPEMNTTAIPAFSLRSLFSTSLSEGSPLVQDQSAFTPSSDDIAYRAYLNYQNHGSADGHDLNDWLRAEAELIAEQRCACPSAY